MTDFYQIFFQQRQSQQGWVQYKYFSKESMLVYLCGTTTGRSIQYIYSGHQGIWTGWYNKGDNIIPVQGSSWKKSVCRIQMKRKR